MLNIQEPRWESEVSVDRLQGVPSWFTWLSWQIVFSFELPVWIGCVNGLCMDADCVSWDLPLGGAYWGILGCLRRWPSEPPSADHTMLVTSWKSLEYESQVMTGHSVTMLASDIPSPSGCSERVLCQPDTTHLHLPKEQFKELLWRCPSSALTWAKRALRAPPSSYLQLDWCKFKLWMLLLGQMGIWNVEAMHRLLLPFHAARDVLINASLWSMVECSWRSKSFLPLSYLCCLGTSPGCILSWGPC